MKFVEESDKRERYGLVKGYCELIEDLFQKLRREEWYVVMTNINALKGTKAHENWRYLTGQCLINHAWKDYIYDGHPEGKMFLKVHLHVLLHVVGFSYIGYREELIEKHWGELLPIAKWYKYGKIWNMYFAYGKPQRLQWFDAHAGTLYGAAWWKWLNTVSNMYADVVSFLRQRGKIESPILHKKDDYYVITLLASGVGKQDIY